MDRGNWDDPDTTYNYDTNAAAPDPVTPRWSSLYAAEQYSSCPKAVKALSYDWSGMREVRTRAERLLVEIVERGEPTREEFAINDTFGKAFNAAEAHTFGEFIYSVAYQALVA